MLRLVGRAAPVVWMAGLAACGSPAWAAAPQPAAAAAQTIAVHVDAREAPRNLLHARLTLPVRPGPLTLVYPKWIPGEHGPTGPLVNLTGLRFSAGGRTLPWTRDPGEMYALRCEVPAGAAQLEVELDYILPSGGGFTGGRSSSARLLVLSWNTVLLYPLGRPSDALRFEPSLQLPPGWSYFSALPEAGREAGHAAAPETPGRPADSVRFEPVSLTRLVDSPLLAGAHVRGVRLGSGVPAHALVMAADSPAALELPGDWQAGLERLAEQAGVLFGSRHYRSYRWLLALSDQVEHFGLEHHEESDNRLGERTLLDGDRGRRRLGGLLAHEFVHSWNGKFRRPAELLTPDFQQPMKTGLLWVYEGLTQYLGTLLATRSGLWTAEELREHLAEVASRYEHAPGRSWRALGDTATAAQVLYGAPHDWAGWRREVDFYDESTLIWLEAETLVRRQSGARRSLDDLCRAFHGGPEGPYEVKPYTRADLLAALQAVAPHDWDAFLAARVEAAGAPVPLGGVHAGGWKLVYDARPNVFLEDREHDDKLVDETRSIGVLLHDDEGKRGLLRDVLPNSAAGRAGLAPGMRVVAVNGRRFSKEGLRAALAASAQGGALELLVENREFFESRRLDYRGGLRFPHLVRDESRPDELSAIFAPQPLR